MAEPTYRWVIVAAGGLLGCVAAGSLFSLPVLLNPMAAETGWSRTGISTAMTISFLSMAVSAMGWGALSDRFGPRPVVFAGGLLFALSLWLAGRAPSLVAFQLAFGVLAGCAVSAFFAPTMASVTAWFETRRSLAVSLVSAGMGLAPVTMSPLVAQLVQTHDWRSVLTILSGILLVTTLPLSLLLRKAPALTRPGGSSGPAPRGPGGETGTMSVRQAVTSGPFLVLVFTNFFCCATHSGPIFHTVSYAELCGIGTVAAVSIYSLEGIAGMGGRIGFGLLGDRLGAKPVLVAGLLAQAVGALGYFFASSLVEFYVVAAFFGFVYAGVMPLYSVLVRENFPLAMLGTIMGGISMAGGLGMATGPVLGGWLFDRTGGYGALYVTSCAMGLGACLIAMLFRPFPTAGSPLPQPEPRAA